MISRRRLRAIHVCFPAPSMLYRQALRAARSMAAAACAATDPPARPTWCTGVPEPSIFETGWEVDMCFTEGDDPDRMAYEWTPPAFVGAVDTSSETREIVREDVDLGDRKGAHAYMLHNVFAPEECAAMIDACNVKGFTPALVNIGRGRQTFAPGYRKGLRCVVDNTAFAALMYQRIAPHLEALAGWRCVGVNERLRVLCYREVGDSFHPHCDGSFARPNSEQISRVTLQLYLNTIPAAPTNGGGTRIFRGNALGDYIAGPVAGSVLVFTQGNVMHEGCELLTGGIKYTVRTELMYESDDDEV